MIEKGKGGNFTISALRRKAGLCEKIKDVSVVLSTKSRHKIEGAEDAKGKIHRYVRGKKKELKAYKRERRFRKEEETRWAQVNLYSANRKGKEAKGNMHKRSLAGSMLCDSPSLSSPQCIQNLA